MKEHSWVCTLVTQIFFCSLIFIVINIGQPQKHVSDRKAERGPLDVLFMSVVGGYRPLEEQILLLKLMAKVAKVYKAEFVVNISELGEEDPLTQNATGHFQSLNIPWYTTKCLQGKGVDHYLKQVKLRQRKALDLIAVNSELLQGPPTVAAEHQLLWLTKTLEESTSVWRIIVGFHPLLGCSGSMQSKEKFEDLHHMFLRNGVNGYMSGISCAEYVLNALLSNATQLEKGPYLNSVGVDEMSLHHNYSMERVNGFLLHRVSSLEFVTYFVNLNGEVVQRTELQQSGKAVM